MSTEVTGAKEYLQQIRKCDLIIQNKRETIQALKDAASRITPAPSDGIMVKKSKRIDGMESRICEYLTMEQELEDEIIACTRTRLEVIATLEQLPPTYNSVLYQVYVLGKTTQEVAIDSYRSYSWAKQTHRRAIQALQDILDGKT